MGKTAAEMMHELLHGTTRFVDLDELATNPEADNHPLPVDDLDGLRRPEVWPYRPILPVKRQAGGERTFGVVREGHEGVVYLVGLFELLELPASDREARLDEAEFEQHTSWQAILAAGWVCD